MVPALVSAIKSHGLALVVDRTMDKPADLDPMTDSSARLPRDVDGVLRWNGVLRFDESIDV